jgi:hypothetical protein
MEATVPPPSGVFIDKYLSSLKTTDGQTSNSYKRMHELLRNFEVNNAKYLCGRVGVGFNSLLDISEEYDKVIKELTKEQEEREKETIEDQQEINNITENALTSDFQNKISTSIEIPFDYEAQEKKIIFLKSLDLKKIL